MPTLLLHAPGVAAAIRSVGCRCSSSPGAGEDRERPVPPAVMAVVVPAIATPARPVGDTSARLSTSGPETTYTVLSWGRCSFLP